MYYFVNKFQKTKDFCKNLNSSKFLENNNYYMVLVNCILLLKYIYNKVMFIEKIKAYLMLKLSILIVH